MPDTFIGVPIEYDANQLYLGAIDFIRQTYPAWTPGNGSKIDMLLRLGAYYASIGAENASRVDVDIFRYFGSLANKLPNPAVSASALAEFTMQDDAGYSVPAFTPVGLKNALMESSVGFQTVEDLVVPPGQTTGQTFVVQIEPGAIGNSLDTVARADSVTYVSSITLVGTSGSGADAELTQDYIDRLSREFELWTTTPIRGHEFAIRAQSMPAVHRCAAWENYNPEDETDDNERYVTLCPIDVAGNSLSSGVKTELQNLMLSLRETGFICPVVDPTETIVDVTYTAHASSGTSDAVKAEVLSAVSDFFNRATWGAPRVGGQVIPLWINTPKIRLNKLIQVIENIPVIDWVEPITIGVHGGTLAATDIDMTGAFPLPTLGTVTGTIVFN